MTVKERFKRTEQADRMIYRKFIDRYSPNNDIELKGTDILCCYDLIQTKGNDKHLIEIKTRWDYGYNDFEDISIDEQKIRCIKGVDADNAYICAIFPKDDKIVLIDITDIRYDDNDVVKRYANAQTISESPYKKIKSFIPLRIKKGRDERLNTITYVFNYPNLKDEYNVFFQTSYGSE